MTLARTIKLYKLPPATATPGLRPMVAADAPAVARLLNSYLSCFKLAQHFSADEVQHWCASPGTGQKLWCCVQSAGSARLMPERGGLLAGSVLAADSQL
jgi:glycylpeptide N-tetradecanoyltransferase